MEAVKRFLQKKYRFAALYAVLLALYTIYILLDTFLITKVYKVVEEDAGWSAKTESGTEAPGSDEASKTEDQTDTAGALEESGTEEAKTQEGLYEDGDQTGTAEVTETSYRDQNIQITLRTYREYDSDIYVADVVLSSAEYLKTAFAQDAYGKNVTEKTSEIAKSHQAVLAVNGDYYGAQTDGYVLRNGTLYRDSASRGQADLVIWADGSFELIEEGSSSAADLLAKGAEQILSFGPALVAAGEIAVSEKEEVGRSRGSNYNPRTAIGIIDSLHYVFVVVDGRTDQSTGLTLYQLAEFMQRLGADTAYNLDGGGSSAMYFNGELVNRPTTNGRRISERSVSDIVYIG